MKKPGGWSEETFKIVTALQERVPNVNIQEMDFGFTVAAAHPTERKAIYIQRAHRPDRGRRYFQMKMENLDEAVEKLS